jgi:hypothetical protein
MSSHQDYVDRVVAEALANPQFAPENGQPLRFQPGDLVTYTNDYGVKFDLVVSGLYRPDFPCSLYATGRRYLLNMGGNLPVHERSLEPRV